MNIREKLKNHDISMSIDQYLYSASSFMIPFLLASQTSKPIFNDIALLLIILSLFVGIANSTIIFLLSYHRSEVLQKNTVSRYLIFYFIFGTSLFYLFSNKSFSLSYAQLLSISLYGAGILYLDIIRKFLYINLENSFLLLVISRILGLTIFVAIFYRNWEFALIIALGPPVLVTFILRKKVEEIKSAFKWRLNHFKQCNLFLTSFVLSHIPIYLFSLTSSPNFLAEIRVYQLLAGAGTIALLPIEIIIIRKFQLNRRDSFEDNIHYPLNLVIQLSGTLAILAGLSYTIVAALIDWFYFSLISLFCLQVQWACSAIIFLSSVKLRSLNSTRRQVAASLVGCMMGSLFSYSQSYSVLGAQDTFGLYLMMTSISSAMILTYNRNSKGKFKL